MIQASASGVLLLGVASPYAWDVVESARRLQLDFRTVDNFGGADPALPGLGMLEDSIDRSSDFVIALASAPSRAEAATGLHAAGFTAPRALVDSTAIVASSSKVSHGAYVNAGVVVGANSMIGCHANVNRSASIGHDNTIGFAASIAPGAILTGHITVGAVATVGAGAVLLPGISIGRRAVVGAGAVVTKRVGDFEVVVGNPARLLRTIPDNGEDDVCPHC